MGIAENRVSQKGGVAIDLALAVEPSTGVVEIDVAVTVESREVGVAKLVEDRGLEEIRTRSLKGLVGLLRLLGRGGGSAHGREGLCPSGRGTG